MTLDETSARLHIYCVLRTPHHHLKERSRGNRTSLPGSCPNLGLSLNVRAPHRKSPCFWTGIYSRLQRGPAKRQTRAEARHILTKVKGAAWCRAGKWVGRESCEVVL